MNKRFVLLIFLLLGSQACADAWIYSFDGPHRAYQIRRDGTPIPLSIFQTIRPDDEIKVLSRSFRLTLGFPDGSKQTITKENSPYTVQDNGEIPTRIDNFLYWTRNVIEELGGQEDLININMVTRGRQAGASSVLVTNNLQYLQDDRTTLNLLVDRVSQFEGKINDHVMVRQTPIKHVVMMVLDESVTLPLEISIGGNALIFSNAPVPQCPYNDPQLPSLQEACSLWLFTQQDGKWQVEALSRLMALERSSMTSYLIQLIRHAAKSHDLTL